MFIVNVEAAIYKEDHWLIIERSKREEHAGGLLSLVGGKVDNEGNSIDILERTIKREVYEEVGVEIEEEPKYIYSSSFVTDLNQHVINIVFLCKYKSGKPYPKSIDEVKSVNWMKSREIKSHSNTPLYLKESIERAEVLLKST